MSTPPTWRSMLNAMRSEVDALLAHQNRSARGSGAVLAEQMRTLRLLLDDLDRECSDWKMRAEWAEDQLAKAPDLGAAARAVIGAAYRIIDRGVFAESNYEDLAEAVERYRKVVHK